MHHRYKLASGAAVAALSLVGSDVMGKDTSGNGRTDRQTGGRRRGTADHETRVDRSVERVLEKFGLRLLDEVGIWTVG